MGVEYSTSSGFSLEMKFIKDTTSLLCQVHESDKGKPEIFA